MLSHALKPRIYQNAQRSAPMLQWLIIKLSSNIIHINDKVELANRISRSQKCLIVAQGYKSSNPLFSTIFEHAAYHSNHANDLEFILYENKDSTILDLSLTFYRDNQAWISLYDGFDSLETVEKFINYGFLPISEEVSVHNYGKHIHSKLPMFWIIFDYTDTSDKKHKILNIMNDVISLRRQNGLLPIGSVYSNAWSLMTHLKSFNLDISTKGFNKFPVGFFLAENGKKYHYTHENNFEFDRLYQFIEAAIRSSETQELKFGLYSLESDYGNPLDAPIDHERDPVHRINTEYHDSIVYDTDKTAVVQYYTRCMYMRFKPTVKYIHVRVHQQ